MASSHDFNFKEARMRAETQTLVDEIRESLALLRRHL